MSNVKTFEQFNESFSNERKYFLLNGYYADDPDNEVSMVATNYDDMEEDSAHDPDFYGFDESDIINAIEYGEAIDGGYIITSYSKI